MNLLQFLFTIIFLESAIKPAPEPVNSEFPESTVYAASILQMIKSDPDKILNVAIPMISSYNLMSKETFQVFEMGLRMIPKTSYFPDIMDGVTSLTINIASTGKMSIIINYFAQKRHEFFQFMFIILTR